MAEVEIKQENLVYAKPELITDNVMHYCPGCSHGTVHKLVAEVIAELGLADRTVGVSPVGCSVFAYNYIDVDWIEAAHGRALAVATAVKRLKPGTMVFTYQGDGDLSAIGTAESIHAAARGENVVGYSFDIPTLPFLCKKEVHIIALPVTSNIRAHHLLLLPRLL